MSVDTTERTPAGFWIGLALGVPVIAYGVRGVLADLPGVQLTSFVRYFAGAAIVHDLVLGPLVCIVGWLVARRLPRPAVAPVQAALIVSGFVGLVAWPFLRTDGATGGEPSFLSRDYSGSLLAVWAVVWVATAVFIAARVVNARRR